MNPVRFSAANKIFHRPQNMTAKECGSLYVFDDDQHLVSCWKPTWQERLALLLGAKIWLWIWGRSQPPVVLATKSPFIKEAADE